MEVVDRWALLDERLPAILGEAAALGHVIACMLRNAADAMAHVDPAQREVVVRTAGEGDAVVLEVRDRGIGIAPAHRAQVFEAFFTTKRGAIGLGLAIARGIVEAHGGRIAIASSEPLEGTVVVVRLPVAQAHHTPPPAG